MAKPKKRKRRPNKGTAQPVNTYIPDVVTGTISGTLSGLLLALILRLLKL